jgi:hypothetical protein
MTHCSVCKQNHDGTGCPMDDDRPVYNQAMDVIEKLKADHLAALEEYAKYKAFWEWSRLADKQSFERYDWEKEG